MNRGAQAMKIWRKQRRLNQDQAARRACISQSSWGEYELGTTLPGGRAMAKLKAACGIDPNLFLEEIPADEAGQSASEVPDAVSSLSVNSRAGEVSGVPARAFSHGEAA